MFARKCLAVLLVAAGPATVAAQGFEYAPGTQQFRVTQTTKVTQEAMGQKQDMETSDKQLFTITLARQSRDTIAMTTVVDSLSKSGPMGPTPGLDRLFGFRADAKLSPSGALYSVSTKDSTIAGATELAQAAGRFLPRIRSRLAIGASWTDTVAEKMKQTGIEVDRRTISRYAVTGDTTVAGEKSWKLSRSDSTSLSGTGSSQGTALSLEGTATGQGTLFVSQRGALVGGVGAEQANIKIVVSASGMEIGVVTNATTRIEKVK
jgi:hypothetical protein